MTRLRALVLGIVLLAFLLLACSLDMDRSAWPTTEAMATAGIQTMEAEMTRAAP